jgi:ribosomal protein S18 acetylase RimI-like enzyme
MKIKQLAIKSQADAVLNFFFSGKAFTWELSENEKKSIQKRIDDALRERRGCRFWYFEDEGEVVAAGSVEKDEDSVNGYTISWIGVHEDYRRQGLGRKLMEKMEEYVHFLEGRFVTLNTATINKEATTFYGSLGYKIVGEIPNYYGEGDPKVIYYKDIAF